MQFEIASQNKIVIGNAEVSFIHNGTTFNQELPAETILCYKTV